jgi:hypothetical protein
MAADEAEMYVWPTFDAFLASGGGQPLIDSDIRLSGHQLLQRWLDKPRVLYTHPIPAYATRVDVSMNRRQLGGFVDDEEENRDPAAAPYELMDAIGERTGMQLDDYDLREAESRGAHVHSSIRAERQRWRWRRPGEEELEAGQAGLEARCVRL